MYYYFNKNYIFDNNYFNFISENMQKSFNLKRFLTGTISFGAVHSSLICMVLIPFLKDSGMLPLQLSILLTGWHRRTNFRQLLKTLTAFSPGYYLIKGSIISILQTYLPSAILRERRFWESIQISVQILNSPLYSVSVHRRDLHREPSL